MIYNLFLRADLRNSDLRESILAGAVLDGADLRGADLSGADIGFSGFKGADVRGAKMLCERIFDAAMDDIIYDANTVFPEGFRPAAIK